VFYNPEKEFLMQQYKYTWKIGIELFCNRDLEVDKPIQRGAVLIDLGTGQKYLVGTVFEAGPKDRFASEMPKTVVQTMPVGTVADGDLKRLRELEGYVPSDAPFSKIIFAAQEASLPA
jgi:hypothetical protein